MRMRLVCAACIAAAICATCAHAVEYGYYEYHADVPLNAISGTVPDSIWAVGDAGRVLHYDGATWSPEASGAPAELTSVSAVDASRAYAVGGDALLVRDGSGWRGAAEIAGASKVEALPDGRAWVLGTAGIYRFDGAGAPTLLPLAAAGRIEDFSLIDGDNLWLVGTDAGAYVVYSYLSGTLTEVKRFAGWNVWVKGIYALDNRNVWVVTLFGPVPGVSSYALHWYDGADWLEAPGAAPLAGVKGFGAGEVYVLGMGVYRVEGAAMTPAGDSLLELQDIFAVPGGDRWCIDDDSILHYRDWPMDTVPVGTKIAGYWGSTIPWGHSILAAGCLQPTDRMVDVYVLVLDPWGTLRSVLPGNSLKNGVHSFATGIGPLSSPLRGSLFQAAPESSMPGTYTIGVGVMPAGRPFNVPDLLGSDVGILYDHTIPIQWW